MPEFAINMTEMVVLALVFLVATAFILYTGWWLSIDTFLSFRRKRLQQKISQASDPGDTVAEDVK